MQPIKLKGKLEKRQSTLLGFDESSGRKESLTDESGLISAPESQLFLQAGYIGDLGESISFAVIDRHERLTGCREWRKLSLLYQRRIYDAR